MNISQVAFLEILRNQVLKAPDGGFKFGDDASSNCDFMPTLAWWLGLSPVEGFPSNRKYKGKNLLEAVNVEPKLVKNDTQWRAFNRWAIHLGFMRTQKSRKSGELIFPTLVTPFDSFFKSCSKGEVFKAKTLIKKLQKSFPMIDATDLAKEVDEFISFDRPGKDNRIGPVVYDALRILEEKGKIKISSASDKAADNQVFQSPNLELETISQIEVQ